MARRASCSYPRRASKRSSSEAGIYKIHPKRQAEQRRKLDRLIWRHRLGLGIPILIIAVLCLGAFAAYFSVGWERGAEFVGTAVGLSQPQTDQPTPTRWTVRLKRGPTVVVRGTEGKPFVKGTSVTVRELAHPIFGLKRYELVRYGLPETKKQP